MNITTRDCLVFFGGLGLGVFLTNASLKKTYQDKCDSQVEDMRQYMKERIKSVEDKCDEVISHYAVTVEESGDDIITNDDSLNYYQQAVEKYSKMRVVETPIDLSESPDEYYRNDEDDSEENIELRQDFQNLSTEEYMKKHGEIFIIDEDDYTNSYGYYAKLTLYYYENEDTLIDEEEIIITDPSSILGDDALTRFGECSEDSNVVYVRNEKLGVDYEVIRTFNSFSKEILGIGEDE